MKASFKQLIEEMSQQKAPGPSMTFTVSHIFFALELMAEKPIGRNKLSRTLKVGEGTMRTIISRLKTQGLVETAKAGCSLTNKGWDVWKKFESLFPKRTELTKTELTNSEHNYAFLVKSSGQNVKSGIEQRDAAIVAGATGAVIIVSKNGHLTIESVSNRLEKRFPAAAEQIRAELQPKDNDVIVLAGAPDLWKAKHGAFAASWSLVRTEKLPS